MGPEFLDLLGYWLSCLRGSGDLNTKGHEANGEVYLRSRRFLAQPSLTTWCARPTARESGGTGLVITDPAPI